MLLKVRLPAAPEPLKLAMVPPSTRLPVPVIVRVRPVPDNSERNTFPPNVVVPLLLTASVRLLPLFVTLPLIVRSFDPPIVALPVVTLLRLTLLAMVRAAPLANIVGVLALVPPSVSVPVPKAVLLPIPIVPAMTVVPAV